MRLRIHRPGAIIPLRWMHIGAIGLLAVLSSVPCPGATLPLSAALVLTPDFCASRIPAPETKEGYSSLGKEACKELESALKPVFTSLVRVTTISAPEGVQIILVPQFDKAEVTGDGLAWSDRETSIALNWTVTDKAGKVVWTGIAKGSARGKTGTAFTYARNTRRRTEEAIRSAISESPAVLTSVPELASERTVIEAVRETTPDLKAIEAQVAQLKTYKPGATSLDEFYADKWTAEDAHLSKLGIILARSDGGAHSIEFDIAHCGGNRKAANAMRGQLAGFRQFSSNGGVHFFSICRGTFQAIDRSSGSTGTLTSLTMNSSEFRALSVDTQYPLFSVRFVRGVLTSVAQTGGPRGPGETVYYSAVAPRPTIPQPASAPENPNLAKMSPDMTCSVNQIGIAGGSGPIVRLSCWLVARGYGASKNLALANNILRQEGAGYTLKTADYGTWHITGDKDSISIALERDSLDRLRTALSQ